MNLNTYFVLSKLENSVPSWMESERYYNCEGNAFAKLLSWFIK